ncbi:MAG: RDD family protein [Lachnospiraceae bacterium]
MQNHDNNEVNYGGFFPRLAAYLLDRMIVAVGLIVLSMVLYLIMLLLPTELQDKRILFQYTLVDIILYLCGVTYFIVSTYCTGTTLGKRAMNLAVVNADGSKLCLSTVIYRETIGRFLCVTVLCIGYLMIGIDSEKKGLHDILCDTRVIYRRNTQDIQVVKERTSYDETPRL